MSWTSGVKGLDPLIGGILDGDNVVVAGTADAMDVVSALVQGLFLGNRSNRSEYVFIVSHDDPVFWANYFHSQGLNIRLIDARAGNEFGEPVVLSEYVIKLAERSSRHRKTFFVFDSLSSFAARWGYERAARFYVGVCPVLFELGAIAYWLSEGIPVRSPFFERVGGTAQVMLEVTSEHLRVVKADGRTAGVQGALGLIRLDAGGQLIVDVDQVHTRLSRGLGRIRQSFGLSQTVFAQLAGVSASAISQAEAGHRGLSLGTILQLAHALGLRIDDFLGDEVSSYLIARNVDEIGGQQSRLIIGDTASGVKVYSLVLESRQVIEFSVESGLAIIFVQQGVAKCDLGMNQPLLNKGELIIIRDGALKGVQAATAKGLIATVVNLIGSGQEVHR